MVSDCLIGPAEQTRKRCVRNINNVVKTKQLMKNVQ